MGDKFQIHSLLGVELPGFFYGKNKEAGVNLYLVTFLNLSFRSQDVPGVRFSGPWLGRLFTHLALERQPEFVGDDDSGL